MRSVVTLADVAPAVGSRFQVRLAVVDANTAVRSALPLILPTFTFSGGYATCTDALAAHPDVDVLVLDANAGDDGPAARRAVESVAVCTAAGYPVCVYTMDRRPYFLAGCLGAGARGLVLKSDPLDALDRCLRQIARGGTAVSDGIELPTGTTRDGASLTPRQQQVLAGRARGESFHKIARRMDISERTAQQHWTAVARRFSEFLLSHSPADLERSLGLDPGAAPLVSRRGPGRG